MPSFDDLKLHHVSFNFLTIAVILYYLFSFAIIWSINIIAISITTVKLGQDLNWTLY